MNDDDKSLEVLSKTAVIEKSEWDAVADAIRQKVQEIQTEFGEAPERYVHQRKGAGGEDWDYVRPDFFEDALDKHLPDWSYGRPEIHVMGPEHGFPKPVVYAANILTFTIEGVRRIIGAVGEKQVEFSYQKSGRQDDKGQDVLLLVTVPGAAKAADTDCFKRCCVRALRLARNIYRKKDDEHYADFNLRPRDIEVLEGYKKRFEEILPDMAGEDANYAASYLKQIKQILESPDKTMRAEVIDIAKRSKIITDKWRENHAS